MKISRDWLTDFIDFTEKDPAVIADRLTRGMGEVDDVTYQGALLGDCVVGKVLTTGKHPNADKLSVCTVETDKGVKKVVCGGTNLKEGMLVAFAHVGATVKAGGKELVTLQKVKIRGEESEGMLCASEEVELESLFPATPEQGGRPIADLTKGGYKPGTPLRTALGMTDVVFHIDNHAITNRPDLFSHIGVARELVAMGLATWKKQKKSAPIKFGAKPVPFTVKNDAGNLIPYFEGCLLKVEGPGETPEWMKRRLEATGWRSINLIVDITNYVLMEVGMPLHAFDSDDFKGELHIRQATKGEKITTLDKQIRNLPDGALIISDDEGIFDIFGVMGGLRTSNKPTTKHIFVQAGIPDPVSIRRTVIAMAHRTDAATVYEKGVLPTTAEAGLKRAVELLLELAPGASVISKPLTWGKKPTPKTIKADPEYIRKFIGATISDAAIKKILTDVGCEVKASGKMLSVTAPEWRKDIAHIQDLVEEVARIHGYAAVTPAMPEATITPPPRDPRIHFVRDALKEQGYLEMLHLAFASPTLLKKFGIDPSSAQEIENPLGEELSRLRPAILPAMLDTAERAVMRMDSVLKMYEYGHIFQGEAETMQFALLVAARGKTTLKESPVLLAKADLIEAFEKAGYALSVEQTMKNLPSFAHAARSAVVRCQGKDVGLVTEIHPNLARSFGLPGRAAAAVIDMEALFTLSPTIKLATPLPKFPDVTLDETIPLPKAAYAALAARLKAIDPLLHTVVLADLYESAAASTMTLRFTYRAEDRTLTQEEVEKVHAKVLAELKKS